MCKWNKWGDTRIDPCMRKFIKNLIFSLVGHVQIVACCCGHQKYPMTIMVRDGDLIYDLVSGKKIPRKKRFYKRDKQGFYYIPEVSMKKDKIKCFWCNKYFVDLVKHSKKAHPKVNPRSYGETKNGS